MLSILVNIFAYLKHCPAIALIASITGCASAPISFNLLDAHNQPWPGHFEPGTHHLTADIRGKHYTGFYIVSHGTSVSTTPIFGYPFPQVIDTVSDFTLNSARATLVASDGERLSCQFLFEHGKALGDCHSSSGDSYQLVTDDHP